MLLTERVSSKDRFQLSFPANLHRTTIMRVASRTRSPKLDHANKVTPNKVTIKQAPFNRPRSTGHPYKRLGASRAGSRGLMARRVAASVAAAVPEPTAWSPNGAQLRGEGVLRLFVCVYVFSFFFSFFEGVREGSVMV